MKDEDRYEAINSVYELNLNTLKLQLHSRMNDKRQDFGACAGDGNILFVCGGSSNLTENICLNSLEMNDFKTKNWIKL